MPVTANATTWYVDSSAAGANNGTSWANAWTSLSSISGVKSGDTVYISGGASGSSHTYSLSGSWRPPAGSSGSPVTYQIGQDSAHNGTAIFSGSGYCLTPASYTVISGDAGDGNMHFATAGFTSCVSLGTSAGVRVAYFNFGNMSGGVDGSTGSTAFEFDHNYCEIANTGADHFMSIRPTDGSFDGTKIHNNTILVPRIAPNSNNSAGGADGFQINGTGGWSLYSNDISGYICTPAYSGGQHQDGVQPLSGTYIKIFANHFHDLANSCIFLDGYNGAFNHVYIYNNICDNTSSSTIDGCEAIQIGPDGSPAQTPGFNDVIVDNNVIADTSEGGSPGITFGQYPGSPTPSPNFTACYAYNNLFVNAGTLQQFQTTLPGAGNNVSLTTAQAQADFVQYHSLSAGNNYQLTAAATALIGTGVNQFSYFTTDKNNNLRPAIGAWDIGAYMYGSSPSGPTLTVSPITDNASDVDPNTPGLQIYEGTTVQFSSVAAYTGSGTVGWQWTFSVDGGPAVVYQSGTGAVPGVSFNFATGTGGHAYVWTLSATAGTNSAGASLSLGVETPPASNTNLTFQAASGVITVPFIVTGNYVSQPVTSTTISTTGKALYNFTITDAGSYVIQALVNAPNDSANSFYVNIDAQPADPTMCWDIFPYTTNFQNRLVSWRGTGTDTNNQYVPKIFNLAAGAHQIIFAGREANTELQSFSLLELTPVPQGLQLLPAVATNAPTFSVGP